MKKLKIFAIIFAIIISLTACGKSVVQQDWQEQFDLGLRFLNEENYEEAIIAFEAAIKIDPKLPEAYIGLANVYIEKGDLDKAREILEKGLENNPGNEEIILKIDELKRIPEVTTTTTVVTTTVPETTTEQTTVITTTELVTETTTAVVTTTVPITEATTLAPKPTKDYITIKGEQYSTSLTELDLSKMKLTDDDIKELSEMKNLTELDLSINYISDISPLAGLTNLTKLDLSLNYISDISPLSGLTNLTELALNTNKINDVSSLAGLKNLTGLFLYYNDITDVSPLAGLTNLTAMSLYGNEISDISSLSSLKNLTSLYVARNKISKSDIDSLRKALPNCQIG